MLQVSLDMVNVPENLANVSMDSLQVLQNMIKVPHDVIKVSLDNGYDIPKSHIT
jgi:hypothetical protein